MLKILEINQMIRNLLMKKSLRAADICSIKLLTSRLTSSHPTHTL